MNYTKSNNTYFTKLKDDPKDRIELEVGDSKQPDFKPQVKIMRWDNEVNFSARLKDFDNFSVSTEHEKIKAVGDKREIHLYNIIPSEGHLDSGYEFEVILKEKPATNRIEFTINTKGLDFFYQPRLTDEIKVGDRNGKIVSVSETEAKDNDGNVLVYRPENVVGSYAIYTSENKINYVGGKLYRTGKVGHIYRPKIIDSVGSEVWGELDIDVEKGILSVTIPQDFLDGAVYPVRHAAGLTFGHSPSEVGASSTVDGFNGYIGPLYNSPSDVGVANSISAATYRFNSVSRNFKGAIWLHSNLTLVTNAVGNAILTTNDSPATYKTSTFTNTPSLIASTDYIIGIAQDSGGGQFIGYDTGSTNQGHSNGNGGNYAIPGNFGTVNHDNNKYSVYCTYTAGGSSIKTVNGLAYASVKTVNGLAIASVKTWNGLA